MNIYEILIGEIEERLKTGYAGTEDEPLNLVEMGVEVTKLKQFKGEYEKLKASQAGRITIGFPMHRFGTEKEPTNLTLSNPDQESDLYVMLTVASRRLYSDETGPGIFEYLYIVQQLLIGFENSVGPELSMFHVELTAFEDNTWFYQILMRSRDLPIHPTTNYRAEPGSDILLEDLDYGDELCTTEIVTNLEQNILIPTDEGDDILIK